jgi:hypothetical protein
MAAVTLAPRVLRGLCALGLAAFCIRCGSSAAPEAKAPDSDNESADAEGSPADSDEEEEEEAGADGSAEEPAARADPCADGSCFACGTGFCPPGFYCDESAQGGPGCAWLPACAPKMTCSCIEREVSGCACSESGGAPHLTCS